MAGVTDERREKRHETRRELILDAAASAFAEVGFERATLDDVGERVGLSKASLYYYVDGKDDLLDGLLERVATAIVTTAAERVPPDADPVTRLEVFLNAHVEVALSSPEGRLLAENLDVALTSEAGAARRSGHEKVLAEILDEGIARGYFRPVHSGAMTKMIFGAMNSVPRWFDSQGALSLSELADCVVEFVVAGVSAESSP